MADYTLVDYQEVSAGGTFPFTANITVHGIQPGDWLLLGVFLDGPWNGSTFDFFAGLYITADSLNDMAAQIAATPPGLSGGSKFGTSTIYTGESGQATPGRQQTGWVLSWVYGATGDDTITVLVQAPLPPPPFPVPPGPPSDSGTLRLVAAVYRFDWDGFEPGLSLPYESGFVGKETANTNGDILDTPAIINNLINLTFPVVDPFPVPTPWLSVAFLSPGSGAPSEGFTARGSFGMVFDIETPASPQPMTSSGVTGAIVMYSETLTLPLLALSCMPQNTATIGVPYSSGLVAIGGTAPFTFSLRSGSLPPGLSLDPATGIISGTPTAVGAFPFQPQVEDALLNVDSRNCQITISLPSGGGGGGGTGGGGGFGGGTGGAGGEGGGPGGGPGGGGPGGGPGGGGPGGGPGGPGGPGAVAGAFGGALLGGPTRFRCCSQAHQFQAVQMAEMLRQRVQKRSAWPYLYEFPPPGSDPVEVIGGIDSPSQNVLSVVLEYRVPKGFNFYLCAVLGEFEGGPVNPGDALWTIDQNAPFVNVQGMPVQGLVNVPVPLGSLLTGRKWQLPRTYEFAPLTLLRSTVVNQNLTPGLPNRFTSGFFGFLFPAKSLARMID